MCVSHSGMSDFLQPRGLQSARLSMAFPRQEYWSGLPLPTPGDLPDPWIERGWIFYCCASQETPTLTLAGVNFNHRPLEGSTSRCGRVWVSELAQACSRARLLNSYRECPVILVLCSEPGGRQGARRARGHRQENKQRSPPRRSAWEEGTRARVKGKWGSTSGSGRPRGDIQAGSGRLSGSHPGKGPGKRLAGMRAQGGRWGGMFGRSEACGWSMASKAADSPALVHGTGVLPPPQECMQDTETRPQGGPNV